MKFKKISKAGGITLPVELRRDFGFSAGQAVDINVDGDALIIKKYVPRCILCGTNHEVVNFADRHICKACIRKMGECL